VRVVACAALASAVPGFVLGGLPEAACSVLTTILAVLVLASWGKSP
jgi:hypothetical protein